MNTQKIGSFLQELRKQENMTQEELGEIVGVTNKTISRWETGNYMPPIDCLETLSSVYQISINEIIGGKRWSDEEYKEQADQNIKEVIQRNNESIKIFEKRMMFLYSLVTIITILIMVLLPHEYLTSTDKIKSIFVIILTVILWNIAGATIMVTIALNKTNK